MAGSIENDFLAAYEQYADAIFRHCYFRVFDRERARELTQETFLKTWEYLAAGKEIENLRAFLYRVAQNLIVDEARRRKGRKEISLESLREQGFDLPTDSRDRAMRRMDGAEVFATLAALSPEDRDILLLRFGDELDPREIAEVLGITANAASVRIHRARKRLKELLKRRNIHG